VGDPFFFFFFSLEIPGVFFSPVTQTQTQKSTFVAQEGMSLTRTSQEKKKQTNPKKKNPFTTMFLYMSLKSSLIMIDLMTLI
jgi:hypothetical protein